MLWLVDRMQEIPFCYVGFWSDRWIWGEWVGQLLHVYFVCLGLGYQVYLSGCMLRRFASYYNGITLLDVVLFGWVWVWQVP